MLIHNPRYSTTARHEIEHNKQNICLGTNIFLSIFTFQIKRFTLASDDERIRSQNFTQVHIICILEVQIFPIEHIL